MKPNRTERFLHWRIELFKVCITVGVAGLGAILTLAVNTIGGWAMGFSIILATTAIGFSLALGLIVYLSIRKLPDD